MNIKFAIVSRTALLTTVLTALIAAKDVSPIYLVLQGRCRGLC